ncbi:hypothetical protein [Glycomyces algeriensis]|uniref:Uncharacterized protein n=1 Tax=Glycomyces algeriensis TaxID=256037 RepID=A0A9W6G657_9ACTN|nr:hypothetical protein [Glycomyces algeriensis]MDA1366078.1 hypothetical protein [Glycomyces algeriensis]MDR7349155.1 hypothetical protein [Glycomyces algeriensis]GLI41855.1 hypothetical protein GALLR39Z86_17050 [Glycomyces algeriensis]
MSSIEEASGSVATNADSARELAGSITSSKDLLDSLAARLDAIGVETTARQTQVAGDRAEELAGHANALADALDSLRQQVDALKGLLAGALRSGAGNANRGRASRPASASGSGAGQEPLPLKGPVASVTPTGISKRHFLGKLQMKSPAKERNTVVLPGVDTDADIAAIKTGRAAYVRDNLYKVNDRTYGVKPTGTVYPVRGNGFVELDKLEYTALKGLKVYKGDRAAAERDPQIARFSRHMTDKTWETARNVFNQGQERA